ncbi:NAD(P)H-dependent oxidoreductase [Tepidimicrobium xylanilyticum]|uniref:Nitroreductase n=1 Tax=Tepidimicrobium xylanilyticum TaxID=1123352 RepID=A0A1H2XL94_9FIRM|nr:NAD(P)H-dependent oxidoreductase [Tepidimicrobium xylanilyticum]GMG97523.1 NAD(P)H-dependent oxidoreductase [Tepidimicrobium xylanilyticum]SDW93059.1 Nitroreductase [Tepidimicrobium xylanilyticum]
MDNRKEEILKAHRFRFACKEFDENKKVPKEDLEFILEVGRLSPSSFGFEPWKFLVVESEELKEKILPVAWGVQRQMSTLSYLVIILARKKKDMIYSSDYIRYMVKDVHKFPDDMAKLRLERYKSFQENDFKLLQNNRYIFDWAVMQTYIPLGNMMTAAAQIGIDTCPIEGFNREKLEEILESEGVINSEQFGVACMLAFGYRKEDPKRPKTRKPMEEVVEWIY